MAFVGKAIVLAFALFGFKEASVRIKRDLDALEEETQRYFAEHIAS